MHTSSVINSYKTAPALSPNIIGWNSTILSNEIFNQLMISYGKPTPNAVHQNNLTFFSTYSPKNPPELLFNWVADCQEIAKGANIPFTTKQLLMNVVYLFMHLGAYACDMDNWEHTAITEQTNFKLSPFIQAAYQCLLASRLITALASGYASTNCFAGLTTKDDTISNNGTTKTIMESINTHLVNLSASILTQSTMSNDANTAIFNASMQQVTTNKSQCNSNHNRMMQQFMMMMSNNARH